MKRFLLHWLKCALLAPLMFAGSATAAVTTLDLVAGNTELRWLRDLVARFNDEQRSVVVRVVGLDAGGHQPVLAIRPAVAPAPAGGEILAPAVLVREAAQLLPEAAAVVADPSGRPQALPLALSAPLLYYDKRAFRAAGLDPERAPKTWFEVQQAADKLFDAGSACPFTSSEPAGVFVEQISVWHGEAVFGADRRPLFNSLLPIKHVALMASWYKSRFLRVFGRRDEADAHFLRGECGMLVGGSHRYPEWVEAGIDIGVTRLPVYDDIPGAPKHTLADGLALWIMAGHGKAKNEAAARFVRFLLSPAVQAELVGKYGFLPFAEAGLAAARAPGNVGSMPHQAVALAQVAGSREAPRLAHFPRLREIVDEELEAVWAGTKPAKEALDTAMVRARSVPRWARLKVAGPL